MEENTKQRTTEQLHDAHVTALVVWMKGRPSYAPEDAVRIEMLLDWHSCAPSYNERVRDFKPQIRSSKFAEDYDLGVADTDDEQEANEHIIDGIDLALNEYFRLHDEITAPQLRHENGSYLQLLESLVSSLAQADGVMRQIERNRYASSALIAALSSEGDSVEGDEAVIAHVNQAVRQIQRLARAAEQAATQPQPSNGLPVFVEGRPFALHQRQLVWQLARIIREAHIENERRNRTPEPLPAPPVCRDIGGGFHQIREIRPATSESSPAVEKGSRRKPRRRERPTAAEMAASIQEIVTMAKIDLGGSKNIQKLLKEVSEQRSPYLHARLAQELGRDEGR